MASAADRVQHQGVAAYLIEMLEVPDQNSLEYENLQALVTKVTDHLTQNAHLFNAASPDRIELSKALTLIQVTLIRRREIIHQCLIAGISVKSAMDPALANTFAGSLVPAKLAMAEAYIEKNGRLTAAGVEECQRKEAISRDKIRFLFEKNKEFAKCLNQIKQAQRGLDGQRYGCLIL